MEDKNELVLKGKDFIRNGKCEKTFDLLFNYFENHEDEENQNEIILLSNQYENLQRRKELGLIYQNEELNEITMALLNILDQLKQGKKIIKIIRKDEVVTGVRQNNIKEKNEQLENKLNLEVFKGEDDKLKMNISLQGISIATVFIIIFLAIFIHEALLLLLIIPSFLLIESNS